jgi:DNA-binding response OmpR family regulator
MAPPLSSPLGDHDESMDEMLLATRPRRILLAEDDKEMRHLLASVLSRDGWQVIEAQDGCELLQYIGSLLLRSRDAIALDLVISDVRMPGRSGLDVLAGLRRADWATPFILITAFGSDELHREARRLGAAAVFDKPFEIDELRAAVLRLVPPPPGTPSAPRFNATSAPRRRRTNTSSAIATSNEADSRILLAEDDDEMRALLASVLRRDGYEVFEARTGAQLLDRLDGSSRCDGKPIEIVITDLCMPGLSGIDVLASVRARPGLRPVILITAFGNDDLRQQARLLGAAAVFDKPFDVDDLRMMVINLDRPRGSVDNGCVGLDDSRRPANSE